MLGVALAGAVIGGGFYGFVKVLDLDGPDTLIDDLLRKWKIR